DPCMNRCARCNTSIDNGFVCLPCRSDLHALATGAPPTRRQRSCDLPSPISTLTPEGDRKQSSPRREKTPVRYGWNQILLLDGGLSIEIRANDLDLLRQCLTCRLLENTPNVGHAAFYYLIDASSGPAGRHYTVISGNRTLAVVSNRAEVLRSLISDLRR